MLNIYKASAGSGKTFTLAYQYICLLLGTRNPDTGKLKLNLNPRNAHRHILAITFTVKATEEMKRRILHELAVLAGREPGWTAPSPYIKDLIHLFDTDADHIRRAADIALNAILFDFNYFSISTIDSFFQIVLRTFAREAELSGSYDIELDNTVAIDFGVNQMISNFNHSNPSTREEREDYRRLSDWIYRYMESKIDSGATFNLFNRASKVHAALIKFVSDISGEEFMLSYDSLMKYLQTPSLIDRFARAIAGRHKTLREEAVASANALKEYIDSLNLSSFKKSPFSANALKLIDKICNNLFPKSVGTTASGIINDFCGKFLVKEGRNSYLADDSNLQQLATTAMEAYISVFTEGEMLNRVSANLFILGLMGRIYTNIEQFRADNDLIMLSDTGTLLRGIIGDDDAPFVYERIGQWYNHFLIDEFQDTSVIQWSNLRPLITESLATSNDNLIIGDEKQCIYRFRDSDPTLLRDLHTQFPDDAIPLKKSLEGNTNWRSMANVIKFNNTLFYFLGRQLGHGNIYNAVVQPVSGKYDGDSGFVKAVVVDCDTAATFEAFALEQVVKDVRLAFDNGYKPADIAILVRWRSHGQKVINTLIENKAALGRESLRIVSDDSMGINQSPAVRLIVSIIRYLSTNNEPADSTRNVSSRHIAAFINRFEYFLSLGFDEDSALRTAIEQAADSDSRDDEIANDVTSMTCLTLPSLVERIIARFISPGKAADENLYITAFQDMVVDYSERGGSDLRGFLAWWDTVGCNRTVSGAQDSEAIRVMTIHKSKGLEFKWTIVPFVCQEVPSFKNPEWFEPAGFDWIEDREIIPPLLPLTPGKWMEETPLASRYRSMCADEILDELNVTYVALTRAGDTLITYVHNKPSTMGEYVTRALEEASEENVGQWQPHIPPEKPLSIHPVEPLSTRLVTPEAEPADDDGDEEEYEEKPQIELRVLTLGEPAARAVETEKPKTALEPDASVIMTPYRSLDRADIWANTALDDESRLTEAGERGILLHSILSGTRHRKDIGKTVKSMVHKGILEQGEGEAILDYLTSRLNREDVAPWFEGFERVLIERPISNVPDKENKLSHRRPDRVVWTADGRLCVIDYKTGGERRSTHRNQVRGYMKLLAGMGYDNIEGYLWYLDEDHIVKV